MATRHDEFPEDGRMSPRDRVAHHSEYFVRYIKQLIGILTQEYPDDSMVDRIHQRICMGSDLLPIDVVEGAGSYLYQFRKQIRARDLQFFLDNTYDEELASSEDLETKSIVEYIIPRAKDVFYKRGKVAQDKFMNLATTMLDHYLEFRDAYKKCT